MNDIIKASLFIIFLFSPGISNATPGTALGGGGSTSSSGGGGTTFTGGSVANVTTFNSSVTIVNGVSAASGTFTSTLTANGMLVVIGTTSFYGDAQSIVSTATFNASQTINWQTRNTQYILLTGNVTSSTWNNPADGGKYQLILCQDGGGSHTFVWPTSVVWPNHGTAPTLTTTALRCDFFVSQYLLFDQSYHVLSEALNN